MTGQSSDLIPKRQREVMAFPGLSLPIFPCLAREAKIPNTDSIEKITKPVLIAEISPG
jgi:hypothetical protein